jgi:hypothetical protein
MHTCELSYPRGTLNIFLMNLMALAAFTFNVAFCVSFGLAIGFLTKFRKTGYETIFVFRENERRISRVSQFRETAKITKETSFAKHENRKNEENLK